MQTSGIGAMVVLAVLIWQFPVSADKIAVADDGRTVLLKDDGSWKYQDAGSMSGASTEVLSFDFRSARWGMSKDQVKSAESVKLEREEDDLLIYVDNVAGLDAWIIFMFVEDRLVRSKYVFVGKHTNENDYISDFQKLEKVLTAKYGQPKSGEQRWRNNLYRNDSERWGFAVSLGHLAYDAAWETKTSNILLKLSGENYEVRLVAEYRSKALGHLEDLKHEKATRDRF